MCVINPYEHNKSNTIKQNKANSKDIIILYRNITDSNMTSFCRCVNDRAIYRLGIISLAHAPVHVTGFPVVNVHVDELSSGQI